MPPAIALTLLLACVTALPAADWLQLRGPGGLGIATAELPAQFSPARNVVWKTAVPAGKSSPIVSGNRLCLTGAKDHTLETLCLDHRTGKLLWREQVQVSRQEKRHDLNHPASPTPVSDGQNLYVFFSDFGIISYTLEGKERWRMPLDAFSNLHGMASSPVLVGSKLILACDQDTNAYLLAVHKDSGKVAWKTPRGEFTHGFSTPAIYAPAGRPAEVILPGAYQMTSYSADTGEKLWWVRGLVWQPKSAPIINGDVLYFNGWAPGGDPGQQKDLPPFEDVIRVADRNGDGKLSPEEVPPELKHSGSWGAIDLDHDGTLNARDWGFYRARRAARNGLMAVRLGGKGDVTATHVEWRFDKALPDVPAPLLYDGTLYLVRTGGIFTTVDARTGEVRKQGRLTGALEGYYASPVAAGGKIFAASEHGKVVVIDAKPEWEVVAINDFEEDIFATPAFAGSRMFLRTASALYAIGR